MTRKHYKAIAAALLTITDTAARRTAALALLPTLREANPLFNQTKFLTACGL